MDWIALSEFLQIPVHMDLPSVGHNLQDHIAVVGLEYLLSSKIGSSEQKSKSLTALFDYFVFGKGDLCILLLGLPRVGGTKVRLHQSQLTLTIS